MNKDNNFPKHATGYQELYAYFKTNYNYNEVMTSAKRALSLYLNNLSVN
ncbi:sterile alpha motif-like domain-containing protein [Staphylococcus aureus]|nr:sterile alpha motif-like domain-containing protein [Staphylococcus aureus]MCS5431358.1 sterile alpha motif-like domain-containing protein [Staphylococcus aureus]